MNINKELYTSPEMKVVEIKAKRIICQSGDINDMLRKPDQELDW